MSEPSGQQEATSAKHHQKAQKDGQSAHEPAHRKDTQRPCETRPQPGPIDTQGVYKLNQTVAKVVGATCQSTHADHEHQDGNGQGSQHAPCSNQLSEEHTVDTRIQGHQT
jgi:hypothetical protein